MRILAIYFVMFNHTRNNGFFHFSVVDNPIKRWIYLFMSLGCKVAVPLFFMISGALLLNKEESVATIFRKRIWKFACILVAVSYFYWMYLSRDPNLKLSFTAFLKAIYMGGITSPLWYLYSYLAILLMLPLLRRLAQTMKHEDYLYLAVGNLFFTGVIPIVDFLLFKGDGQIYSLFRPALFVNDNIMFVLMGHYFEHVLPSRYETKKTVMFGVGASAISIFISACMTLYRRNLMGEYTQSFYSCFLAIPTYTIYLASKLFFKTITVPNKLKILITEIGGTTFGIYLLEGMLRQETRPIFQFLQPHIKTMPACLIWIFCALALGSLLVWILKKLPGVNRIL